MSATRQIHEDWSASVGAMLRLNGGASGFINTLIVHYDMTMDEAAKVYQWLNGRQPKPAVLTRGRT